MSELVNVEVNGQKKALHTGLFINNEFVPSVSGKKFPTINPATGQVIAEVYEADKADVDKAVQAAKKCYEEVWSKTDGASRGLKMWKLADLIEAKKKELAEVEALDNGKSFKMAFAGDVTGVVAVLRYYAGWADKIHGKVMMDTPGFMNYTRHEPMGVVAGIVPWNFPLSMVSWKLGPALACGNCIIIKSSEKTPLSALQLGDLIVEAGFPPGCINILSGYGPTAGQAIVEHPDIRKVAFTGSTRTGRRIAEGAAKSNLKKVSLELGGKSPAIVFEDADLDNAIVWTNSGIYRNMGQVCAASSRVYVQESIAEKFLERYKQMTQTIKVGDQFDADATHGPQVDEIQFNTIMKYIKTGVEEDGATLVTGGKRHGDQGYFIEPTIFTNVKEDAKIMREEIFGPVVAINTFKTEEEVIKRANNTTYGLAACLFTKDVNRAIRVSNAIEAGSVYVNCHNVVTRSSPFGGFKESGWGRELGEYALEMYTEVKTVKINLGA